MLFLKLLLKIVGSSFFENGKQLKDKPGVPSNGFLFDQIFMDSIADDYFSTRWFVNEYKIISGKEVDGVKVLSQLVNTDPKAQYRLGLMYENGQGVPQDYKEAVKWYRLAAGQGHAHAQYNLGIGYAYGQGVLQDNVMAHMWYDIGAANGSEVGGTNRDSIAEGMTQQAIEQAQAMARECMSSSYQNCGY